MSSVSAIDSKKENPQYENEFIKHPLNRMKKELVHNFEKIEKRIFLSYQCGIYKSSHNIDPPPIELYLDDEE